MNDYTQDRLRELYYRKFRGGEMKKTTHLAAYSCRAKLESQIAYLEELVCLADTFLQGLYDMKAMPLRTIETEAKRIRARERRNAT